MIDISIKNCNNIIDGELSLCENQLNLIYAMNGTGKSTIGTAINLESKKGDLSVLKHFSRKEEPTVNISKELTNVLIFNEDFVNTIVFKESEVIENAFEIFLKTPKYEEARNKVNKRISKIRIDTESNETINLLLTYGKSIISKISLTNDQKLKKVGVIKSILSSENVYKLPEEIKHFQPFMDKDYSVDWVGWKTQGNNYDDNDICPFCADKLSEKYENEKKVFTNSYTKSNVKNIKEITSDIEQISKIIVPGKMKEILKALNEDRDFELINMLLSKLYLEISYLIGKFNSIMEFNSFRVKSNEVSLLDDKLKILEIDIKNLDIIKTKLVIDEIKGINNKIEIVMKDTAELKKEIGELKALIGTSSQKAMNDINDFLDLAGIKYFLKIEPNEETSAKSLLLFKADENEIELNNIRSHLSWGERNAFALVLFLHYALNKDPNLVILDDPISSFDSNKKYAIINRLFCPNSKKDSLYKKTVLMMTHDFQPMIDFIVNKMPCNDSVNGKYLINKNGNLEKYKVEKKDIISLPILLIRNAKDNNLNMLHRIVCLRKLIEHTNENPYQDLKYNLLSCLIHGKPKPTNLDDEMIETNDVILGEQEISKYIDSFKYDDIYEKHFKLDKLLLNYYSESNTYFKLQIFRIILTISKLKNELSDDSIIKYINEQFHVENDYIFYLDFSKFDIVPNYIISKCDEFLIKKGLNSA